MPKCPYCNAINEIGAEREYMEDLGELKEDLAELSEVPKEEYKKEVSKNIKRIVVIIGIVVVLLLVLFGLYRWYEGRYDSYQTVSAKEQLIWEKENFPKLDELYEAGDYEAIVAFENQVSELGYSTYNWEHAPFINEYRGYTLCMEQRDVLTDKERANKDSAEYILGETMRALFFLQEERYSEEEWQIIQSWRPDYEEILYEDMKFTREEALELYEKIGADGYISYSECDKYAGKIWKRFIE